MKQCILICSHEENAEMLDNLLRSIKEVTKEGKRYPIVIVVNDGSNLAGKFLFIHILAKAKEDMGCQLVKNDKDEFEIGALKRALEETGYEEFFLLHDSCEVKDAELFDVVFEEHKGKSVGIAKATQMYLGKYRRDVLEQMDFPHISSKRDSVEHESKFTAAYKRFCGEGGFVELWRDFSSAPRYEEKFGRKNQILENDHLKKYKGTWKHSMIK